jgi:hypothetical protein
MTDLDELRRTYSRVEGLLNFYPADRIWWIYMRNAAIEVAMRAHLPELKEACELVKAFPENAPNERARWMTLRQAVARLLERN